MTHYNVDARLTDSWLPVRVPMIFLHYIFFLQSQSMNLNQHL